MHVFLNLASWTQALQPYHLPTSFHARLQLGVPLETPAYVFAAVVEEYDGYDDDGQMAQLIVFSHDGEIFFVNGFDDWHPARYTKHQLLKEISQVPVEYPLGMIVIFGPELQDWLARLPTA